MGQARGSKNVSPLYLYNFTFQSTTTAEIFKSLNIQGISPFTFFESWSELLKKKFEFELLLQRRIVSKNWIVQSLFHLI